MLSVVPYGKIIQRWLIDNGHGTLPSANGAWPISSPILPPEGNEAICVGKTGDDLDGTILKTGEPIVHPDIQVRIRAKDHDAGWAKGAAIRNALVSMMNASVAVTIAPTTYNFLLCKFTLTADLTYVGLEDQSKRPWFTINGTITIQGA